ncbi:MAG: Rpn family recombination-promoting nuclease/putative transposase [Myxococcota bacterium]
MAVVYPRQISATERCGAHRLLSMADQPHDALFRFAFTQPAVAAAHFRAVLPGEVADAARWDTLELVPGSFVDEDLTQVHSDVLHRVALAGGGELWLYVLFEHQSTVDTLMSWRMLRYLVRIWERALEGGAGPLPFVWPLVLYHGERRWTAPVDFEALFAEGAVRDALLPHVPRFRYVLQDLSVVPDEALRGVALREAVLLAFKHARGGTVWVPRWLDLVVEVAASDGLRAVEALWRYVVSVGPGPPPPAARDDLVRRLPPEGQRLIMGYGEQLIEQGREEGLQAGREEGLQAGREEGLREGRVQGELRVLLKQLQLKFGALPEAIVARVEAGSEAELEQWAERILVAETLEAVLA